MPTYIHQLKNWPHFQWNDSLVMPLLAEVVKTQGTILGRMEGIGFSLREEASLETLTTDVVRSSEIEGALLDAAE